MYVPAYFAIGTTAAFLSARGNVVQVDAGLHAALASALSAGDWTYLRIQNAVNTEIVRVFDILPGNSLAISRGKDGTVIATFLPGASVYYVDTVAGLLDMLHIPALGLTELEGISVDGYDIGYPELSIETLGGAEIAGNVLTQKLEAAGCCGVLPNVPPPLSEKDWVRVTGDDDYRVTSDDDYRVPA